MLNDGDFYNASSGVFTAPFTGVYLFSYSIGAKIIPGVHLNQYDVFTRLMVENDYQVSLCLISYSDGFLIVLLVCGWASEWASERTNEWINEWHTLY